MYESHFGLRNCPFEMTPDPAAIFLTDAHREALAGLSYSILKRKGFVVLTGKAGTGKTTLLRRLLEMTPGDDAAVSMVFNPTLSAAEFLELLLLNFGMRDFPQSKAQRLTMLEALLTRSQSRGKTRVLVVDEAHKLNLEVLEEIRLLANFETSDHKLLQIVLAGQPELDDLLRLPELWQLKQRIAVWLRIHSLSPGQVIEYMQYRWTRLGGGGLLPFTPDAVGLVAKCSSGIPRLINAISDNALLIAFGAKLGVVGGAQILEAARDLDLVTPAIAAQAAPPIRLQTLERYLPGENKGLFGRWASRTSREGAHR